jgi:hypothetical protein
MKSLTMIKLGVKSHDRVGCYAQDCLTVPQVPGKSSLII